MREDIEELKGVKIPREISQQDKLYCDICNKKIDTNEMGVYVSDVNISEQIRSVMTVDVIFCQKCNPKKINYPHLGINEINFTVFTEKYNDSILVKKVLLNHISKNYEGTIWTPQKLWNRMTEANYEPESAAYVSEKLLHKDIPLQDVIKPDGKLDINYIMNKTYDEDIN